MNEVNMSGNKKTTAIKTPLAFEATLLDFYQQQEDRIVSKEEEIKIKDILKKYEELNKLYDQCLERIQVRKK